MKRNSDLRNMIWSSCVMQMLKWQTRVKGAVSNFEKNSLSDHSDHCDSRNIIKTSTLFSPYLDLDQRKIVNNPYKNNLCCISCTLWMTDTGKLDTFKACEKIISAEICVYHENWNHHENWDEYHKAMKRKWLSCFRTTPVDIFIFFIKETFGQLPQPRPHP